MDYINAKDLQLFMNKYVDDDKLSLINSYCKSAIETIKKYLKYNPVLSTYTYKKRGDNSFYFSLPARNITEITTVKINGETVESFLFMVAESDQNYICYADGITGFDSSSVYEVTFKAGWKCEEVENEDDTTTVINEVPQIIKLTALQVASLFWESAGGNLAVSSTSFADTGSRVFNNFTCDRFLNQIDSYRIQL